MPWLVPSVIATMTGTVILAFCYFYLYTQDKQKYLKIWAISWAIYFARYMFLLTMLLWQKNDWLLIGNQLSTLISGVLLLYGSYLFIDKKFPTPLGYLSIIGAIWIFISVLNQFSFMVMSLPTFSFLATIYIWTGYVFYKHSKSGQKEASIVGISFIAWGIHKANYPFLRPVIWFAPWGYLIAALLEFLTALGIILVYFRKTKDESQEAEDALRKSQERFNLAMNASQDGLYDWNLVTNKIYYSPSWKGLLGYNDDELPNDFSVWETLTEPEDVKRSWEMQQDLINKKRDRFELEFKMKHKDGHWIDILSRAKAIFNEDDVAVRIVGTHVDISKRKQAELELIKSENQYNAIVENSGDYIMRYDRNHRHIWANQNAIKATGLTPEQYLGKTHREMHFPEHLCELWGKNIDEVFTTGEVQRVEFDVELENGLMTLDLQFNPEFDEKGNVLSVIGVSRDITERKKAEGALREGAAKLAAALESMSDAVFISDKDGHFIEFNEAFAKFHRLESKTACLKPLGDWLDLLDVYTLDGTLVSLDMWAVSRALRGEVGVNAEYRLKRKDTGETWFGSYNFAPIRDNEGRVNGSVVVARDITENRNLQARLQQAQKMESIGNLAGGIAHDFNNLLYPIIGYAEMLKEDLPKDSPEHESAQEIFNAGKRGGELVKQILAFSRQSDHKLQPIRIQKTLKEVLKLTRSSIPSDIEMHQDIQQDCGLVMADETQLHQIAMNLITNAYHAVETTGGNISIQLKEIILDNDDLKDSSLQAGQYVILSVSDNGVGIPRELMNNIFEPYFTTKEKGKGTGLGLAVVHGIVKEHKGDIKVYSEVGKGTTFNVYLPLMKKSTEFISTETELNKLTGTERILLVDDEISVVRLEKQMLERLGYNVSARSNSLEALETFNSNPEGYDLVISDMTMPNMTGDQLARELMSIRPDIPIIICTGFSERINKEQAEANKVKGFLMKPVIKSEMAQMVRKVLDEARAYKEN